MRLPCVTAHNVGNVESFYDQHGDVWEVHADGLWRNWLDGVLTTGQVLASGDLGVRSWLTDPCAPHKPRGRAGRGA